VQPKATAPSFSDEETARPDSAVRAMQGTQTSLAVVKTLTGEKTLTLHSQYDLPFLYKKTGDTPFLVMQGGTYHPSGFSGTG
jgi:hypothetical protein